MSKRIYIAIGVVVVLAGIVFVARNGGVDVSVATVVRDSLSVTVPAEGKTRARDRFTVTAPINGRVTRLELEEGDTVAEGRLIARLYATPQDPRVVATLRGEVDAAEARHRQAQSYLREAELQATQAEREVQRRRPLAEMGAVTPERMEQAELAAVVADERREAAEEEVASARATLESARARLLGAQTVDGDTSPVEVRSPVSGRVLSVPDPSARVVAAGSPLLTLAGTDGLEVVMDILSEDAVQVKSGHPLVITSWGGEGTLVAEVRTVTLVGYTKVSALGVEEQRVDVVGDLHERPSSLGTGYRVSGEIVVWRGDDILTMPTNALFSTGETWHVFAVEDGRARLREVALGRQNEDRAEIVDGLDEGETVILFPPPEIEDGAAVQPEQAAPTAPSRPWSSR